MSLIASVSAPSTPTEQVKQIHNVSIKKSKHNRVHFPVDEKLVTCFLEPPDPWSKVYGNTISTLISSYVAACDKQGIKPLPCVLDQLQEYEGSSYKLESNPRAFDLSILGERLSMKHCEALEEVFRRLQFKLVDLEGCYLDDEGAAAFFDMIEYYDSAVQLNISFTKNIDCRGWQACSRMLKKTTSLVQLNARSTGLNEQVLLIIGRALRLGSNLVTLHLENCGIFGRCLVILVAALKLNTTMRELYLAENKISPADGFQLGNLLRTNTHLELLDLSNNKLGDEGLTHVMDSLGQQSNTSGRGLYTLVLWNNELTAKGMPCVSRALTAARALRKLNLGSNSITGTGILELKQSLICNRTIEILELENACITSTGVIALAEYIIQSLFIQKLDIRGNDIRLADLVVLSQAVEKNPNIISLKIDPTSMDLTEPIKERQQCLQEISKCCQRNKEAKSSLPPQDAQLSILFNGIFSHVLPTPIPGDASPNDKINDIPQKDFPRNTLKGRFRVSVVIQDNAIKENGVVQMNVVLPKNAAPEPIVKSSEPLRSIFLDTGSHRVGSHCSFGVEPKTVAVVQEKFTPEEDIKSSPQPLHSLPLDTDCCSVATKPNTAMAPKDSGSEGLVLDRVRWLEGLQTTEQDVCSCKSAASEPVLGGLGDDSEVFLPSESNLAKQRMDLTLSLGESLGSELKVRRSSSPTISTAPLQCRKTHSIKCCKELEGLDLRSTVPLSPTRLHESFDFPDRQVSEVPLNSQMKSSHAVYMVH